jgi:hypothetical protein
MHEIEIMEELELYVVARAAHIIFLSFSRNFTVIFYSGRHLSLQHKGPMETHGLALMSDLKFSGTLFVSSLGKIDDSASLLV